MQRRPGGACSPLGCRQHRISSTDQDQTQVEQCVLGATYLKELRRQVFSRILFFRTFPRASMCRRCRRLRRPGWRLGELLTADAPGSPSPARDPGQRSRRAGVSRSRGLAHVLIRRPVSGRRREHPTHTFVLPPRHPRRGWETAGGSPPNNTPRKIEFGCPRCRRLQSGRRLATDPLDNGEPSSTPAGRINVAPRAHQASRGRIDDRHPSTSTRVAFVTACRDPVVQRMRNHSRPNHRIRQEFYLVLRSVVLLIRLTSS